MEKAEPTKYRGAGWDGDFERCVVAKLKGERVDDSMVDGKWVVHVEIETAASRAVRFREQDRHMEELMKNRPQ